MSPLPASPESSPPRRARRSPGTSTRGVSRPAEPAPASDGTNNGPESAHTPINKEREAELDPNPQSHLAAFVTSDPHESGRRCLHAAGRRSDHVGIGKCGGP